MVRADRRRLTRQVYGRAPSPLTPRRLLSRQSSVDRCVDPRDELIEESLRASQPRPSPEFTHGLEQRLLPPVSPTIRSRRRPLLVGGLGAAGLASALLGIQLIGGGPPLGGKDRDGAVRATDDCRTVTVMRRERIPRIARSDDGTPRVVYRYRVRPRQVKRCP